MQNKNEFESDFSSWIKSVLILDRQIDRKIQVKRYETWLFSLKNIPKNTRIFEKLILDENFAREYGADHEKWRIFEQIV